MQHCANLSRWETGYWRTMDIAHDRAGYYLCWGCLNWVPCLYTSQQLYLTTHPYKLHPVVAAAILFAGVACIYINWDADRQRQVLSRALLQFLVRSYNGLDCERKKGKVKSPLADFMLVLRSRQGLPRRILRLARLTYCI